MSFMCTTLLLTLNEKAQRHADTHDSTAGPIIKTTVIFLLLLFVILKRLPCRTIALPLLINFVEAKWLLNNGVFDLIPMNESK